MTMDSDGQTLCRHFGSCGGCTFQDMEYPVYLDMKRADVIAALEQHGLRDVNVAATIAVSPATRRRAALKVAKGNKTIIGFHARQSHDIVDMLECRVLTPSLVALVQGLRNMMDDVMRGGEKAELQVTETESGPDVDIKWVRRRDPALISGLAAWAERLKLARITHEGHILVERAQPVVWLGPAEVDLPSLAFLQPSEEGEAVLRERVGEIIGRSKSVIDLFAGCGTFSLSLALNAKVHAVDADAGMLAALAAAARKAQRLKPVSVERRDLFRTPVQISELAGFEAAVLDPPRVGALSQSRLLARSKIRRIAYVSCNPATFARDARVLVEGGYKAMSVMPVDQFLWSSHIELVAGFEHA